MMIQLRFIAIIYLATTVAAQRNTPCEMPKATGNCQGSLPRFYFDLSTRTCQPFVFTGCEGNSNNFESFVECEEACPTKQIESPCRMPKVIGSCRGEEPRIYFDELEGQCLTFLFSGCEGNANNFDSVRQCEEECSVVKSPNGSDSASNEDICRSPPTKVSETGISCTAALPMWTFNFASGQCEEYLYGGCGATDNLYQTRSECFSTCRTFHIVN